MCSPPARAVGDVLPCGRAVIRSECEPGSIRDVPGCWCTQLAPHGTCIRLRVARELAASALTKHVGSCAARLHVPSATCCRADDTSSAQCSSRRFRFRSHDLEQFNRRIPQVKSQESDRKPCGSGQRSDLGMAVLDRVQPACHRRYPAVQTTRQALRVRAELDSRRAWLLHSDASVRRTAAASGCA